VTHKDDKFRPVTDETMAAVALLEKASYSVLEREESRPAASRARRLSPPRCSRRPARVWASA
jgi:DNA topoisomerase-1